MSNDSKVIFDNECREYKQGWKACSEGKSYFANPYGYLAYNGELHRLWEKGWNDCQFEWDHTPSGPREISQEEINNSFSITDQPIEP